jgi:hypothetical protein
MPRRIDVELTSDRGDGSWTWRVAGARQPRGVLDGALLYAGVKVGDVVRAEAEFDLDGISVLAIIPPKETRPGGDRLELLAPTGDEPLVSTTLAPRRERRPDRGPRDRRDRDGRDGRDRPPEDRRRPPRERPTGDRDGGDTSRRRRERPPRREHGDRQEHADRPVDAGAGAGAPPAARPERSPASRSQRTRSRPPAEPSRPKPKRLRAGRAHRKEVLASLPPEQRPVAEQVLQGGIRAVRQAIDKQNATAAAEGKPEIKAAPLLALAEELLPRLRTAEWRDRAEAALHDVDELDLRDLRSVVVGADTAARDDDTRALAASLREALARRVDHEQHTWLDDITRSLNDGRVVRALRLSSRPPKAGSIFPRDVATRLVESTSASLTADASGDRWAAVLDALAFAPVRLAVTPQSIPAHPSDELQATVRRLASRLPEVATAFGIEAPPEPSRPVRPRSAGPRRSPGPRRPPAPPPAAVASEPTPEPEPTPTPAEPTEPPTTPAEPTEPPTTPAEPTEPPTTPAEPTEPPTTPIVPTEPATPVDPSEPSPAPEAD